MPIRLYQRAQFTIERWLVRGAQYRVLVAAMLIGAISLIGGVAVLTVGEGFGGLAEAVWWAFLRLSDPGYLGDDVGAANRILSTILTVLGYVVFLGALVAIMTQWLNARMARLESGLTPVARDGHVVILGWTNRTGTIVRELLLSQDRARRFLSRRGTRDLHVVVLSEDVSAERAQDLRDAVGDAWDEFKVTMRSGSALRSEHLERVDAAHAAAIIVPAAEFERDVAASDTATIKILLSLQRLALAEPRPLVIAEIFQGRKLGLARQAYRGQAEILSSDAAVSRLLAQNLRHPGLSAVYNELLTHGEGTEVYIRDSESMVGRQLHDLHGRFPDAVLMGVARPDEGGFVPHLNPAAGFVVEHGDRLVLLARSYGATAPASEVTGGGTMWGSSTVDEETAVPKTPRRVLVMGWSHKVPALLSELASYRAESFEVVVASAVPETHRKQALAPVAGTLGDLPVRHVEADVTEAMEVRALDPVSFESVLLVGSDRLESEEAADARSLMAFLVLEEVLEGMEGRPSVIVELLDAENQALLEGGREEVIISPLILSHMLSQIALRRELRVVFDELFTAGGAEISFHPMERYWAGERTTFGAMADLAARMGETALGVRRRSDGTIHLSPDRGRPWAGPSDLDLVTLVSTPSG